MQAAAECANILRQPFFMKMTETEEFTVKKGNQYEGVVAYVDFPDKGYVTVREETESGAEQEIPVLVKHTLPGQKIRFQTAKKRSGNGSGTVSA